MFFLVQYAYAKLLHFDFYLAHKNFAALHHKVRTFRIRERTSSTETIKTICHAIDIACVCYPKQVLCLQRSAATVCVLRRHGIAAQLVVGAQRTPFASHAWVEVHGQVVNDKPGTPEIYAVLDRC